MVLGQLRRYGIYQRQARYQHQETQSDFNAGATTGQRITERNDGIMRYKVIVYYDNMPDSEHIFNNKNDAINELHRLRGVKYRNSRMYTVEMEEVEA